MNPQPNIPPGSYLEYQYEPGDVLQVSELGKRWKKYSGIQNPFEGEIARRFVSRNNYSAERYGVRYRIVDAAGNVRLEV